MHHGAAMLVITHVLLFCGLMMSLFLKQILEPLF